MSVITIHDAKTNLSKLIQRALDGEEIIIAKRDQPLVRLEVIKPAKFERTVGDHKDLIIAMGDSFNDEMEEFADYWPETLETPSAKSA